MGKARTRRGVQDPRGTWIARAIGTVGRDAQGLCAVSTLPVWAEGILIGRNSSVVTQPEYLSAPLKIGEGRLDSRPLTLPARSPEWTGSGRRQRGFLRLTAGVSTAWATDPGDKD